MSQIGITADTRYRRADEARILRTPPAFRLGLRSPRRRWCRGDARGCRGAEPLGKPRPSL